MGGGVTNFQSKLPAVIQESVSVSTVTCHDASTQTPVHAETQTNLSTVSFLQIHCQKYVRLSWLQLFKMATRQQKRTERKSKEANIKDDASRTRNESGTIDGGSTDRTATQSQNENEVYYYRV